MLTRVSRMAPLKSITISEGIFETVAALAGTVASSGECAMAPVAHKLTIAVNMICFIVCPFMRSVDPIGSLKFAYISGDHFDVSTGDTFNSRHVAERPMVRTHA